MKIEYSQASPEYLKGLLAHKYKLPSTTEVTYLHQGINDTYKIATADEQCILRIYRSNWKSYDDFSGELELIKLISQNEIIVSSPVPDQEGNFIH